MLSNNYYWAPYSSLLPVCRLTWFKLTNWQSFIKSESEREREKIIKLGRIGADSLALWVALGEQWWTLRVNKDSWKERERERERTIQVELRDVKKQAALIEVSWIPNPDLDLKPSENPLNIHIYGLLSLLLLCDIIQAAAAAAAIIELVTFGLWTASQNRERFKSGCYLESWRKRRKLLFLESKQDIVFFRRTDANLQSSVSIRLFCAMFELSALSSARAAYRCPRILLLASSR